MTEAEFRNSLTATKVQNTSKKTTKNNKLTENEFKSWLTASQPKQQVVQPTQEEIKQQQVQQAIKTHGQVAQQAHNQLEQKQQAITTQVTKPMTNYLKNGGVISDSASIAQLAREQNVPENEIQYQLGRIEAAKTPTTTKTPKMMPSVFANSESVNKMQMENAKNQNPVTLYDKNYGKNEAEQEFKSLDFTNSKNGDKYLEYKEGLQEAQAKNDTRNIEKYSRLVKQYQDTYKEKYKGTTDDTDIAKVRKSLEELANDRQELEVRYATAKTLEEKNKVLGEYLTLKSKIDQKYKVYSDALAYDEIMNNNAIKDSALSLKKGIYAGTARTINGGWAVINKATGLNAADVDATGLLRWNNGERLNPDVANTAGDTDISGATQSSLEAIARFKRIHDTFPDAIKLEKLYQQIISGTYKGTADDLRKDLDEVAKEVYQNFKDNYTQDELDARAEQTRHNVNAYGKYSIPEAFGTAGEMVFPALVANAAGGIAEGASYLINGGTRAGATITPTLGTMNAANTAPHLARNVGLYSSIGLGAGAGGLDQALAEGASYNQAFNYGLGTGLTEAGTEMLGGEAVLGLFGKAGETVLGKAFGKAIDKLNIKSKVGKFIAEKAAGVASESVEEMISEAVNPLWQTLTYNPDAMPKDIGKYFGQIFEAGIEAIPSTLLMEGYGTAVNAVNKASVINDIQKGLIDSINESNLSQIAKNQLINEVKAASRKAKLSFNETDTIYQRLNEKSSDLEKQSNEMEAKLPEGYSLPQSTIDILAYMQNSRPGLNIDFSTDIKGNGTITDNGDGTRTITLNPNSQRAVEFTLAHELGHDIKGTKEYNQLQNLLTDYAKGKPGYQSSLQALEKTYKESGANFNLQDEATNDMLGQAIGEQEFYNKLAENPTLFNKITNTIENLLGNKETKLKNKVEKLMQNALKQEYKPTQQNNGVQNSVSEAVTQDNQGRQLTAEQQEFFKNSKVRDENGKLLEVYHGSPNEFTKFDKNKTSREARTSQYGTGFYFTNRENIANEYKYQSNAKKPTTFKVYLKIENPFIMTKSNEDEHRLSREGLKQLLIEGDNDWFFDSWIPFVTKTTDKLDYKLDGLTEEQVRNLNKEEKVNYYLRQEYDKKGFGDKHILKEIHKAYTNNSDLMDKFPKYLGYDGIIAKGTMTGVDQYIVFAPDQIKNVDNTLPTSNPDIRYSISEGENNSQFRDENPKVITLNDASLKRIAKEVGIDAFSLEGNLGGNIKDAKNYLINNTNIVANYAKKNNIPIEKTKRRIVFRKLVDSEIKEFIKSKNLDIQTLANNPDLVEQFLDIYTDSDSKEAWRKVFDYVRTEKSVPGVLQQVAQEMDYIRNGITEIESNELSYKQRDEIAETKEFQNYINDYLNNLFDEKQYTTEEVMEEAKENHGTTDNYGVGAYMTTDGELLDFNYGGFRDDHRTLNVYGMDMQTFMDYGAIRMQPESDGFELAIEPTPEQYDRLEDYIDNFAKVSNNSSTINIDIDTAKGFTDIAKSYSKDTPTERIINDIKTYFRTGEYPSSRYIVYSKSNASWQKFLNKNFDWSKGTRTNFKKIDTKMMPTNQELQDFEKDKTQKIGESTSLADIRGFKKAGNKSVKAYQYENPEVKPFFQYEAKSMLEDLKNTVKGERYTKAGEGYGSDSYIQYDGVKRGTTEDIADLLDGNYGTKLSYDDIRKGLEAIINDNGAENIAAAKRIEMVIDKRLREGYTDIYGYEHNPSENYKKFLNGEEYVEPEKYDYDQMVKQYGNPEEEVKLADTGDDTLFSLSEDIAEFTDKLKKDTTLPDDVKQKLIEKLKNVKTADQLKRIVKQANTYRNTANMQIESTDDTDKKKVRWTKTAQNNELIRKNVKEQDITYIPSSNQKQIDHANKQLERDGYESSKAYLDSKVSKNDRVNATDIALGERLIQEAIKKGNIKEAQELIADVAIMGKDLGQAVQALSMISRLTPEGQLMYLQKVMNKLNDKIETKNEKRSEKKKAENIKLEEEYAQNILEATDEVELQNAVNDALQRIADQMEVSFSDKVAEWRYLAMLANPRTHIRNIVANVGMKGLYGVKNKIQRAIETVAAPLLNERTRTFKKPTADVKKFAEQSTKDLADILGQVDNKTIEGRLKEMQKVFKNATLEKLRRLNSNALSLEDNVFTQAAYKANLQEYLTANNIKTQKDIDLNPDIVQKGINWAKEEAWKTTFHQMSKAATAINNLENINGLSKLIVGGTIPFKKTPINIAKTGAAYSPLGLLETLSAETYKLKTGQINANQYIDRLAQGLTGTAVFGIGALLAKMGILKGGTDKDDEYAEDIGQTKSYSIRLGDKNYDISWLSPSAMPLLMGAELVEATNGKEMNFDDLTSALAGTINPLSEMSFISGLNSAMKSYNNSESSIDVIGSFGKSAAKSYFGQFTPAIGGQINKIIDKTERSTTATKASKWKEGESFARQQLAKIPGASFLLEPKTDVWGNEKKRSDNIAERAFDALINPGTVTKDKTTDVDREIMSVMKEADDSSIRPKVPSSYFTYNSERQDLSAKDYTKFKKAYGQYMFNLYDELFESERYKELSATEKAKIIKQIATNAREVAKSEVGYETSDFMKYDVIKEELEKAGIPLVDYYFVKRNISEANTKNKKQTAIKQEVDLLNAAGEKITNEQKKVLREIFGVE